VKACHIGSPDWWVCCFEIDVSGCTWAMTPVLGDPNVTPFLKALSLHRFCSTCTPTTCQLHVAENLFTLTTYVSPSIGLYNSLYYRTSHDYIEHLSTLNSFMSPYPTNSSTPKYVEFINLLGSKKPAPAGSALCIKVLMIVSEL